MNNIRNFSIIAHIDHGKSTLADRIIEMCNGLSCRDMEAQVLDSMEIERERGITIKAQTAALQYKSRDGNTYYINLIDTPGHVDFSYEVSRSLSACEGALLLIDVSQGVEAQTVANYHIALDLGLKIILVLNKIDIPFVSIDKVKYEIQETLGIDASSALQCSAKTGSGVENVLEALIKNIPPPLGRNSAPLQALIIDSWFDNYVGVVMLIRIFNGILFLKDKILLMTTQLQYFIEAIGIFTPKPISQKSLSTGQVGFIVAGIKDIQAAKVGDTITLVSNQAVSSLKCFKEIQSQVFAGLFPIQTDQCNLLRNSLAKLKLNDAALQYEPEMSLALGFGFRCGFLGLLHMEIIQERLEREFNINLITTAPTVIYEVQCKNGTLLMIDSPSKMPEMSKIHVIREPISIVSVYVPQNYVGRVITLCIERRGIQISISYYGNHVELNYEIPTSEIILDFSNRLKSISKGYASMNYKFKEYRAADVVKIDILINNNIIDALAVMMHRENSYHQARAITIKIRNLIPRQMFDVTIQSVIGSNIIARENVKALRKNVLAKCYGGDISRKRKLLEKQRAGKKRMKQIGSVVIPQEAFLAILQVEEK